MIEFPDYGAQEQPIRTVGDAELLYKRGKKILRFRKSRFGCEDDFALYQRIASYFAGRVLSIGLGMGNAADVILAAAEVSELVSYEVEQDIVDVYTQEHGVQETHTILVADAHENKPSGDFDVILYELESDGPLLYQQAVDYMHWAWPKLKIGGCLLFKYNTFAVALAQEVGGDVTIISRATGMKPVPEFVRVQKLE